MSSGPIQRLTRVLVVMVTICVLGLVAGIVLVSVENAQTNRRLSALEEYVQGKGKQRDAENTRLEEMQRRATCDLLDQLPEGGLLEAPRTKYHCGPGIPLSDLPPAVRQRYAPESIPAPTLTPLPPAASPSVSRPAPGTLPPRTGPGPGGPTPTPPSPDPTPALTASPLRPVTGPVCDLTGLCF